MAIHFNLEHVIDDFKNSTEHRIVLWSIIIIYEIYFLFFIQLYNYVFVYLSYYSKCYIFNYFFS
jgi:hypothetical protein